MHGPINFKSPNNTIKWQMGFNSAFKGLMLDRLFYTISLTSLFVSDRIFWHMLEIIQQLSRNQENLEGARLPENLKWGTDDGGFYKRSVSLSLSLSMGALVGEALRVFIFWGP
jgi:hypothetical protein